ncbi:MAG: hypothetical protein QOJ12_2211, partial [Thermoleophilales bacterium]|nr:hypothetical protein [Thermoleophilales bacterium]
MASLARLIGSPALTPLLGYVARPRADPAAECVALAEDLAAVEKAPGGSIVLLSRSASADAASYRFDMALRRARGRAVAALVLSAADIARVTPTAAAVADRSGTAILGAADGVDLAELAIAIARELAGDAGTALLRAHTALRGIEAHPRDGDVERLIARAGAALGVPLVRVDAEPAGVARAPVVVDDRVEAWLTAERQEGDL